MDDLIRFPTENPGRTIQDWVPRLLAVPPRTLSIGSIRGHFSARTRAVDVDHVKALAQSPARFPPIVVHLSTTRVIDGVHRVLATRRRGGSKIMVVGFEGTPVEAFALSVYLNVVHGRSLHLDERKAAARRILVEAPAWSDRFVANLAGLSHRTVSGIRRMQDSSDGHTERVGRDGKVRPLDPAGGRVRAAAAIAKDPTLSLRELAKQAGISLSTARDVRIRIENGENPLPERLRYGSESDATKPPESSEAEEPKDRPRMIGASTVFVDELRPLRRRDGGPTTLVSHLDRLKRDPAVRHTEAGRTLIRQLAGANGALTQCRELLEGNPSHWAATVAQIAREHAIAWHEFAESIELRRAADDEIEYEEVSGD